VGRKTGGGHPDPGGILNRRHQRDDASGETKL